MNACVFAYLTINIFKTKLKTPITQNNLYHIKRIQISWKSIKKLLDVKPLLPLLQEVCQ